MKNLIWKLFNFFKFKQKKKEKKISLLLSQIENLMLKNDTPLDFIETIKKQLRILLAKEVNLTFDIAKRILFDLLNKIFHKIIFKDHIFMKNDLKVIFFVGANGVGKTTSLAKLIFLLQKMNNLKKKSNKFLIASGDTFRSGARKQLQKLSNILRVRLISGKEKQDPISIIYEAFHYAIKQKFDFLFCDLGGKFENNLILKKNLNKLSKVLRKWKEQYSFTVLNFMVIDISSGRSVISQVKTFDNLFRINGLILTKLDIFAKGGYLFPIVDRFSIPIAYVSYSDSDHLKAFKKFNSKQFLNYFLYEKIFFE